MLKSFYFIVVLITMTEYVIKGRLAEDGQKMILPAIENESKCKFMASYHVYKRGAKIDPQPYKNLIYIALPENSTLHFGGREIPIPFISEGKIEDIRRFRISDFSIDTNGMTLAKIYPNTPFSIETRDGNPFYIFQMIDTPDSYRNGDEMPFGFVHEDKKDGLVKMERGNRIITLPGAIIYPKNCSYRIPGWLAKEFNGSPEFGFAYSPFTEARKGEFLHHNTEIMEPYMGIDGIGKLFVEADGGGYELEYNTTEGTKDKKKGELLELKKGDVLLPMPGVNHKFVFEEMQFPFTQFTINYASRLLNEVPAADRVALEK